MELFLTRVLGLDWSEVDAEADALEHAISPRLEQAIADHLGEPLEDPHGHLIPTREGELASRHLRPLQSFQAGQHVVIREAQDDHPERLRRWSDLGLLPGAKVTLLRHQILDGIFELQVGNQVITLAAEGLAGLFGEAVPSAGVSPLPEPKSASARELSSSALASQISPLPHPPVSAFLAFSVEPSRVSLILPILYKRFSFGEATRSCHEAENLSALG